MCIRDRGWGSTAQPCAGGASPARAGPSASLAGPCPRRPASARSAAARTRPTTASGPTPAVNPRFPPAPPTRRDGTVDVLHGVAVADPYRWLEDGEAREVRQWAAAQDARARAFLDALPQREGLHGRFLELLRAGTVSAPALAGDRVFTLERAGDLDQAVVVLRSASDPAEPPRVVVDPHNLAADHAAARL